MDMTRMILKNPRLAKYLPAFLASYEDILGRYFKNETVLSMMGYQSLYFGLPPALVPGAYAMLPYTEHTGIYYPEGGMIAVPLALQRCGERLGMKVKVNTAVDKVLIRGRRAVGVRLEDGSEISARLVVSNINAKTLYLKMVGEEHLPPMVAAGVKSYQNSLACAMIYLGLNYEPPLEAHHSTVAISPKKLNRYWWEHQEKGVLPTNSFGLICWSTHSDPSLAPKGKHVLNIIPEGFYHLKNTNWDAEKPQFIERVLGNFDKIIPGLEDHIEVMDMATPLDYERQLRLPEGAIYCLRQDLPHENVFRPAARSKAIDGLYLTGASTNPGGGVPSVIASGVIAANLIDRYN
jgi:phytoene desaturase